MSGRKATSNPVVSRFLSIFLAAALALACSSSKGDQRSAAAGTDSGLDSNTSGTSGNSGTGTSGDSDTGTSGDSGNSGTSGNNACISDRVKPPSDAYCACKWDNCNATSMSCTCGLTCLGDNDRKCIISMDGNGNATTSDGTLGACNLSCTPEDDSQTMISCSASDCKIQPN